MATIDAREGGAQVQLLGGRSISVQLEVTSSFPIHPIQDQGSASLPRWFKLVMAKTALPNSTFPLSGELISRSWLCSPFRASSTQEFPV